MTDGLIGTAKRRRQVVFPPPQMERFLFGFNQAVADSLWLRLVQDFDFCEQIGPEGLDAYQRSALKRQMIKGTDGSEATNARFNAEFRKRYGCKKGWVYRMLDTITNVDPRYEIAFSAGGVMLSVLLDDVEGASAFFRKGEHLSKDWAFFYRAAYHFVEEDPDIPLAVRYLIRARELGGPEWLPSYAAKLYSREGQLELALGVLENALATDPSLAEKDFFKIRLQEVRRKLQDAKRTSGVEGSKN